MSLHDWRELSFREKRLRDRYPSTSLYNLICRHCQRRAFKDGKHCVWAYGAHRMAYPNCEDELVAEVMES